MKLTFVTVAIGHAFLPYLQVLLQSIRDVVTTNQVEVFVYYHDMHKKEIDALRKKYTTTKFIHCPPLEKRSREKIHTSASRKMEFWLEAIRNLECGTNVIFLDCDTLVVQNPKLFFNTHDLDFNFDFGFAYKNHQDENLHWPINTGVVFARVSEPVKKFFQLWAGETRRLLDHPELLDRRINLWGGEDQASLGMLLESRDPNILTLPRCLHGIIIRGYPCDMINECRCMPITSKLYIIHYKGKWRTVLPNGKWNVGRPKEKCLPMFDLWKSKLVGENNGI